MFPRVIYKKDYNIRLETKPETHQKLYVFKKSSRNFKLFFGLISLNNLPAFSYS